jgi:hypothetical protein
LRRPAVDAESTFVDGPVVRATEEDEILRVRLVPFCPVLEVMCLETFSPPAPWELTGPTPAHQCPPEKGGDLPCFAADVQNITITIAHHRHMGCVTGETAARFR